MGVLKSPCRELSSIGIFPPAGLAIVTLYPASYKKGALNEHAHLRVIKIANRWDSWLFCRKDSIHAPVPGTIRKGSSFKVVLWHIHCCEDGGGGRKASCAALWTGVSRIVPHLEFVPWSCDLLRPAILRKLSGRAQHRQVQTHQKVIFRGGFALSHLCNSIVCLNILALPCACLVSVA